MILSRTIFFCCTFFLLSACAQLESLTTRNSSAPQTTPVAIGNRWWQYFNDPLMDRLADDLLKQNLDIQIARARVNEARGIARSVESGFFPDISINTVASRGNKQVGFDKPFSIAQGGFDAAWELDVFGQTEASAEAAQQRIEASIALSEDATNTVIAELLRAVIEWRQAEQTLLETEELLSVQDEEVTLISVRTKAGLIDATYQKRAEAERSQTATRLPLAKASLDAAEYKIERLLGKESGSLSHILNNTKSELTVPQEKTASDISMLRMRSRPDLRASRASLLAAQADLAKAEADLWPRISVKAFFGVQDGTISVPLSGNPIWSLATGITAPLLNFGKLRGAIDASNARANAALLSYENAGLVALQESKTALSEYLNGLNAVTEQKKALDHRIETVALATERFKRGLTDMTDVTTAQSELNQATLLYIDRKAAAAIAYLKLHKAMGTSVYFEKQSEFAGD